MLAVVGIFTVVWMQFKHFRDCFIVLVNPDFLDFRSDSSFNTNSSLSLGYSFLFFGNLCLMTNVTVLKRQKYSWTIILHSWWNQVFDKKIWWRICDGKNRKSKKFLRSSFWVSWKLKDISSKDSIYSVKDIVFINSLPFSTCSFIFFYSHVNLRLSRKRSYR